MRRRDRHVARRRLADARCDASLDASLCWLRAALADHLARALASSPDRPLTAEELARTSSLWPPTARVLPQTDEDRAQRRVTVVLHQPIDSVSVTLRVDPHPPTSGSGNY